jgi:DNA-binding LytR/AlgR family response regulator
VRAYLGYLALASVFTVVNASSVIDDHARLGRPVAAWQPWTWELTSMAGWLLLIPIVFAAAERIRPPRYPLSVALAGHALLSLLLSAAHVASMVGLRKLVYAAQGGTYRTADTLGHLLVYEYRKDLLTYAAAALLFLTFERLSRPPEREEADAKGEALRLAVRDGTRTVWLAPDDVEWAQSAGNYVELHGRFGSLLHRETLAALEERLAPSGFRRIHRSRLVRAAAVRSIETRPSGDFDVTLESGARIGGSRRFRERLQA